MRTIDFFTQNEFSEFFKHSSFDNISDIRNQRHMTSDIRNQRHMTSDIRNKRMNEGYIAFNGAENNTVQLKNIKLASTMKKLYSVTLTTVSN